MNAIKCKHCKSILDPSAFGGAAAASETTTRPAAPVTYYGVPTFEQLEADGQLRYPPEYPDTFNPRGWSWPAFLFGPLWYLAKGMWQKALLLWVIAAVTYGTVSAIIAGVMGYRDYVRYYSTGKQFWW